ncbi:hypothetical protein IHE45_12G021800 [Dioscorea alata]|uniref:Uncharacterized protein n=1 Tax=Dioscorea alata TaxID=55571 RepID=A0ACB7V0T8_DIOAL|nr:hypothetical protein IHE45_12G021800 [Dioscorea alata]
METPEVARLEKIMKKAEKQCRAAKSSIWMWIQVAHV